MVWLRIIAAYAAVLALALTLNFALPRMAPGDPLAFLLPEDVLAEMTPAEKDRVLAEFGLDDPVAVQFAAYVGGVVTGDLGTSTRYGAPVWDVVAGRLPWTLLLMGWALALSAALGTALGVAAARSRGEMSDIGTTVLVLALGSAPVFWVAMLLITLFSAKLGWLPSFGAAPLMAIPGTWGYVAGVAERLIMPVTALTIAQTAGVWLTARSAMAVALSRDYVTVARAKGVPERAVFWRHALRNAMLPIYTNVAIGLGALLGGALVVETVFSWPGIGQLVVQGVEARDYNLLQGVFLVATLSVLAANLLSDLTYPFIDPRVRR
ncbi:ABC transporter permease [Salinarimonas sp.]|uniref:ABC transporter permease n=1 Tax=Salinarimonas sp. TaxID=2766526 RepID=UPI0032D96EA2